MATMRNHRNLEAVNRYNHEEPPRDNQSRNTVVPGIQEDYIAQEIKGRVTTKLSREFIRTESRNLGALRKLDAFLLNTEIWAQSETVP